MRSLSRGTRTLRSGGGAGRGLSLRGVSRFNPRKKKSPSVTPRDRWRVINKRDARRFRMIWQIWRIRLSLARLSLSRAKRIEQRDAGRRGGEGRGERDTAPLNVYVYVKSSRWRLYEATPGDYPVGR